MSSRFSKSAWKKLYHAMVDGEKNHRPVNLSNPTRSVEYCWPGIDFVAYLVVGELYDCEGYVVIFQSNDRLWEIKTNVCGWDAIKDISFVGDEDQFNHDVTIALMVL